MTFSAYGPEAAPATVRLYAALVLETSTSGNNVTNSELTVAAMATAEATNAQPSRPARSSAPAATTATTASTPRTDASQTANTMTATPATTHSHTASLPARSRTAPSVLSARN